MLLAAVLAGYFDAFELFAEWSEAYEHWEVDEVAIVAWIGGLGLVVFAVRRWQEAVQEAKSHRSTVEKLRGREQALRLSEHRFRSAFAGAATGVAIVGMPHGRFIEINDAGTDLLGRTRDELLGMTIGDVTHPDDYEASMERFRRVVASDVPSFQSEIRYVRGDGSTAHGLVSIAVVRDDTGRRHHVIVQMIDITEQKRTSQRLSNLLASKDELIASVSHELRTPLTAVVGYAELLREHSTLSPDEQDEMIRAIADQGRDLANIIEDLLVAARMDTDTLTVARTAVDLDVQTAQVLQSFDRGGDIAWSATAGDSVRALGDPTRVRQILRNLVSNALRHGGSNVEITTTHDSSTVSVAVADNGPGVPAGQEDLIFESYHRAHTVEGLAGSVGLGLTVSRTLARLMNGDLTYRRSDERSIFELTLPAATSTPSGTASPPNSMSPVGV